MNVLFITSVYPEPDDGKTKATRTVEYFAQSLSELGHDVVVIHNAAKFPMMFYSLSKYCVDRLETRLGHGIPTVESRSYLARKEMNVDIIRLTISKIIPHARYSKSAINRQFIRIKETLNILSFSPNVILGHWAYPQSQLLPLLGSHYSCPTSLVFHNDFPLSPDKHDMKDINRITKIGARSKSEAERIEKILQFNRKPFICVSGIPDTLISCVEQHANSVRNKDEIIYVGRLVAYKNVETIIKAIASINDYKYLISIIGIGAERANLEALADDLCVSDRVSFLGSLSRENVFEKMQLANIFVMVSNSETFGMTYIEAMLAGCITVASKNGGIDGIIVDGVNGYLCEQGNAQELVDVLRRIASLTDNEVEKIRFEAQKTALQYSDSIVARKYLRDVLE